MTPETTLALYQRGCKAHPELEVDMPTFATALKRAAPVAGVEGTHDIHAEDLYLACACSIDVPHAIARFEACQGALLQRLGRRAQVAGVDVSELLQLVRVRLFVASSQDAIPAIATYAGTGPLGGWLRIVVARIATELIEKNARERIFLSQKGSTLGDIRDLDGEFERSILRADLRGAFQSALNNAALIMSPEERTVLRQFYVYKIGVDGIAKLLGVHRSNASRAVARARGRLLQETKRQLQPALGLSDSSLNSAFGLMRSDVGLSLERLLQTK